VKSSQQRSPWIRAPFW